MGYVADRWHKTRPKPGEPECGQHKGMVAAAAHGKGKRWQARYDNPDGREITSLWATKVEAEREITKQEGAKLDGSWLDPKAGKVTVEKFTRETWLPAQSMISRTEGPVIDLLRRHLFSEWGQREMRSIRPSEAGAWQKLLVTKYKLSGATPNRVARFVRSIFRLAVIDRVIPVSPFEKIAAPKLVETAVQPPDIAEVRQLIAAAYNSRWKAMTEFTALTGLRSGEVRGLRLDRIDFLRRTILVDQQVVQEKGRGLYFDELKTGAGLRLLPVTQRALDLVAAYIEQQPVTKTGPGAGLVFTMPGSELISRSTLDYAIKSTCKKAGLRARHWHELRHHYASVLIAGGENPKVVQRRLGHKDVMMTLRIYAHLFAEAEEQTRDVLDAAWQPAGTGKGFSEASGRIPEQRPAGGVLVQLRT